MNYSNIMKHISGVYKNIENTFSSSQELEATKALARITCIAVGILGSLTLLAAGATTSAIFFIATAILFHHELPIILHNKHNNRSQFDGTWFDSYILDQIETLSK